MLSAALIAGGLLVLLLAGDLLVRGAAELALRLGISALMVGMTVVAFGTSAPELLVSVRAVLAGAGGLALGNVVGSNIANVLLVLGAPALISAIVVSREVTRDYALMCGASLLFLAVALTGVIGVWQALVLLAGFAVFMADSIWRGRRARMAAALPDLPERPEGQWRAGVYVALGVVGLPLGAHLLVTGAVDLATRLGVSDLLIGLTIVAVGTSLPELATTLMAALRREAGVALGNIIGSNLFNLLFILGIAGLVGEMAIPAQLLRYDIWVMLAASALIGLFLWRGWAISRLWGLGLLLAYAAYIWGLIAIEGV